MSNHVFVLILLILGTLISLLPNGKTEVSIALITAATTHLQKSEKNDSKSDEIK